MKKILFLLSLTSLFLIQSARAQYPATSYGFQALGGSYTQVSGGTTASGIMSDDALQTNIPIGFTFNFCGLPYTTVAVSSNGVVSFGSGSTTLSNDVSSFSQIKPALYPLWDDLDGSSGSPAYITTGVAPNRIFTFEFRNWEWNWSSNQASISFQVKLYETSNIIDFVYRQEPLAGNPGGSSGASIGIVDLQETYKSLNNSSAAPVASSTTFTTSIASKPATGQIYRWTPPAPCSTIASGWPASGTTAASPATICVNDSSMLTFTANGTIPAATSITYRWSSGPSATGPWTVLNTTQVNTFKVGPLTATYYKGEMMCGNTTLTNGSAAQIIVNSSPPPTSSRDSFNCGDGTVTLTATGPNIRWYDAPSGGISVGSGNTFTTPVLANTQVYYATSSVGVSQPAPAWVGNGTSTTTGPNSPYYTTWWGNKNQFLIRASEMAALGFTSGSVISMGFDLLAKSTSLNLDGYYIAMKNTATNTLTTSWETGLTTVYTHPSYNMIPNQVNTHVFQTPFPWDGVSNILVEVCFNNNTWGGSQTIRYTTGLAFNASHNYYADMSGVCTSPSSGSVYNSRPNMQLTMESGCQSIRVPVKAHIYKPNAIITNTNVQPICQGDSILLTASADTSYAYQWMRNGLILPGATQSTFHASVGGDYKVIVSQGNGSCRDTSAELSIIIYQMPTPALSYVGPLSFCEGGAIVLTAQAVPSVTYQWYRNNQPIGGATDSFYEATKSGGYAVKITSPQGCNYTSHLVNVTVYPNPTPPIIRNGLVLSTGVYTTYQWYRNNAPIPGANYQAYSITQPGAYLVEVTTPDGCINRSELVILSSLSSKTLALSEKLNVYPNPTRSLVKVDAPFPVNVAVLNISGQVLSTVKNAKSIDLSEYAAGVYIFVITTEQNELVRREKITKAE